LTAAYQLSSRLAAASPADITHSAGTTWAYWDLLGPDVGRTEPGKSGDGPGPCRGNELAVRHPSTDFSSLCPDNNDWLNFVGTQFGAAAVIGAVRVGGELWLAWTAARGGGFAHPHVQVLKFSRSTRRPGRRPSSGRSGTPTTRSPLPRWRSTVPTRSGSPWPGVAAASSAPVSRSAFWATSSCGSPRLVTPPTPPTAVPDPTAVGVTTSPVASPPRQRLVLRDWVRRAPEDPARGGHPVQPGYILFGRRPHGGEPGPIG